MRRALLACFLAVGLACHVEVRGIHQSAVRLQSGDSVFLVATGPIFEPNGDTGLMYEYNPYHGSLDDTLALRALALEVWPTVKPIADSLRRRFVVLRATNRVSELPVPEPRVIWNYGVVLEKRANGLWYSLPDSVPIRGP
jgi:hypothetical protein